MNRAAYYVALRSRGNTLFGTSLSTKQVEGLEAILDEAERRGTSIFHLAAIFSEAHHETGGKMQPVEENLNYSAKRITEVWPSRFPTLASAKPYARNPKALANKAYGGRMGNKLPNDGWDMRGRGLSQITGRDNYEKFGIADDPSKALEMSTAVRILFDGMEKGLFTGKKLSDFDYIVTKIPEVKGYRYFSSRAIVNGDTPAVGAKIDRSAKAFEVALRAAGYDPATSTAPEPAPAPPVAETKPIVIERNGGKTDWITALINAIAAIFKGNRNAS